MCGWPRSHLRSSTLVMQRLAGRSQACVSLGMQRVQARSVRVALCGDRGAGGASSRSQRAPAHCRARERCRFKRGCRAERLVVLRLTCTRQHDGQVRGVKVSGAGWASRSGWGGVTRTPRGRERRPRTVARSQAGEDRTTTPRWRARTRTVLSRRDRGRITFTGVIVVASPSHARVCTKA